MKILVIITGGTIGSTSNSQYTSLDINKQYVLLDTYKKNNADDVEFEIISPYRILSENLTANEINLLIDCVAENVKKDYDGIIVTHGTDTLQYTSVALSYCFKNADKPIVVVSANYPLDNIKSNGHKNFEAAVKFIESRVANGVYVSYKNTNSDNTNIHIPTRLFTHLENTDEVYSISQQEFAYYNGSDIVLNKSFAKTAIDDSNEVYRFCEKTGILVISSIVGDSFNYDLSDAKAVLIRPYHSGTINTADGALGAFCEKAKAKNIPVFILSCNLKADYESTNVFSSYGITKLPLSTFVSQYMKLWIATSNKLNITEFMQKEIAQEFVKTE